MEKRYSRERDRGTKYLISICIHRIGFLAIPLAWVLTLALLPFMPAAAQESAPARVVVPTDHTVLPIPEPNYPHSTILDARDATPPPREQGWDKLREETLARQIELGVVPPGTKLAAKPEAIKVFSADETAGVGIDEATNVTDDYTQGDNAFTGRILKIVVDVQPIGAAQKVEEDKAIKEASLKKAFSD